jgi:hypothetical protein
VTIDQVMRLMRDDRMRSFRIDIETDSTVQADENEYKQRMGEFLTGVSTFVEKVLPVTEAHPELGPFLGEALLTAVRGYRVGRQLGGRAGERHRDDRGEVSEIRRAAAEPRHGEGADGCRTGGEKDCCR